MLSTKTIRDKLDFLGAPGRTEVGGNHTAYNAGRILSTAVDLDIAAAAAPNDEGVIQMHSAGYPPLSHSAPVGHRKDWNHYG